MERKEITKRLEENNLYYDDNYIKTTYLGLLTCKAGLHPLFIGKRGSGLTRFSNLIASNYSIKENEIVIEIQRKKILIHYYFVLKLLLMI